MGGGFSRITGEVDSTEIIHRRIHQGLSFAADVSNQALGAAGVINILIQVGSKNSHMRFTSAVGDTCSLQLFEGTTFSAAGSAVTVSNRNRASGVTALTTITTAPTITLDGSSLGFVVQPANVVLEASQLEWVLLANQDYLLRLTNVSASAAAVTVNLNFYEL
jgi:hypothetical protein